LSVYLYTSLSKMLSSTLSLHAGAAPKGGAAMRSAVSMQLAPAVGERAGSATFVAGSPVSMTGQQVDSSILVQGGSLRTWSYRSPAIEQVQVVLSTEGRPLDADIELWHGPDNTPCKMRVYVENGQLRPFSAVVETPRGPNTVAIRNIGQIEFPIAANVIADSVDSPSGDCLGSSTTIQGGALHSYPFDPSVDSVEVLLKTDGRPLSPDRAPPGPQQQQAGHRAVHGCDRPFFCMLGQRRAHRQHRACRVPYDRRRRPALNQQRDVLGRRPRRRCRHRRRHRLVQKPRRPSLPSVRPGRGGGARQALAVGPATLN